MMGRTYAYVLGLLGMLVVMIRSIFHSAGAEGTLYQALLALLGFAAVGAFLGNLAEATTKESVRREMEEEIAQSSETQT